MGTWRRGAAGTGTITRPPATVRVRGGGNAARAIAATHPPSLRVRRASLHNLLLEETGPIPIQSEAEPVLLVHAYF